MTLHTENGTARLELYPDGGGVAIVYRTVNDDAIVARGTGMSKCFAALADEIGGFGLEWQYPDELELPTDVSEQIGATIERYEEPFIPDKELDAKLGIEDYEGDQ